jgi:hypothetical protein
MNVNRSLRRQTKLDQKALARLSPMTNIVERSVKRRTRVFVGLDNSQTGNMSEVHNFMRHSATAPNGTKERLKAVLPFCGSGVKRQQQKPIPKIDMQGARGKRREARNKKSFEKLKANTRTTESIIHYNRTTMGIYSFTVDHGARSTSFHSVRPSPG